MEADKTVICKETPTKRPRTENWLDRDKLLLKELVRERVRSIENKNTDTNSNRNKKNAWAELQNVFNSLCTGMHRTIPQLKSQWSIIKITAKKEKAEHRRQTNKTGGGSCPDGNFGRPADDISAWLPNEFIIDSNEYDCDSREAAKSVPADDYTAKDFIEQPPQASNILPEANKLIEVLSAPLEVVPISADGIPAPLEHESSINMNAVNLVKTEKEKNNVQKVKILKKKTSTKFDTTTTTAPLKIMENENKCRKELHELRWKMKGREAEF